MLYIKTFLTINLINYFHIKTFFVKECVDWADAVITAGGDGTFLSTATRIKNSNKPLIGINTAPDRYVWSIYMLLTGYIYMCFYCKMYTDPKVIFACLQNTQQNWMKPLTNCQKESLSELCYLLTSFSPFVIVYIKKSYILNSVTYIHTNFVYIDCCRINVYSYNIFHIVIRWLFRQRIRITLSGCDTDYEPIQNGAMLKDRMLGNYANIPSPYYSDDDSDETCSTSPHGKIY